MPIPEQGKSPPQGKDDRSASIGKLPYRIELWRSGSFEKVLARAAQTTLARAIFSAAKSEHPDDVVLLCRGDKVLSRSSD